MPRKFTDAEKEVTVGLVSDGAVILSTIIRLAFDKITEAEARAILPAQVDSLIWNVEKAAEVFD